MSDDLDFGFPEVPDNSNQQAIQDAFDYDVAYNFAFIGAGAAGNRIAHTFYEMGYRRVCALNTARQDLAEIGLPDHAKLDLGEKGAGRDIELGRQAVEGRGEDIRDLLLRNWGDEVDYAFIAFSAGGGTGAGSYRKIAEVVKQYLRERGRPLRVGVIMALPKGTESDKEASNAIKVVKHLSRQTFSPVIVIDNQKVQNYAKPSAVLQHDVTNKLVAAGLHSFNRLAAREKGAVEALDPQDLASLLDSGLIAFGKATITDWPDATTISKAIRDRLSDNVLVSIDIRDARKAGVIYLLKEKAADIPIDYLDHSVQMFNNTLKDDSTVYRGIYYSQTDARRKGEVQVLALVAGLPWPMERIKALADTARIDPGDVAKFLGV